MVALILVAIIFGEPLTWRDCLWMFLAYSEPKRARQLFEDDPYFTPEFGNSRALTYHTITNLEALGHVDGSGPPVPGSGRCPPR